MNFPPSPPADSQPHPLERYYRFHSRIYDASRWSFLFGRDNLMRTVATWRQPSRILEVGCGTGTNLVRLRQVFPAAHLTGLDLSAAMLEQARKNLAGKHPPVRLIQKSYDQPLSPQHPFDLVIFSYALSMFNPGWEEAIDCVRQDLREGGIMAVVDFHQSRFSLFERWMACNHVRLDGHLLPRLESRFHPLIAKISPAYGGLWWYFTFIGEKRQG